MDLSIIIVSYNVRDLLRDCLKSIYTQTKDISFEVFVVDNASSDGSSDMVEKEFSKINLIRNKNNLGFAKANNIAFKLSNSKYILLLNPDTIILDNAIQKMVAFMNEHFKAGGVTPKILGPEGNIQYFQLSKDAFSYSYFFYLFCSFFQILFSKYVKKKKSRIHLYNSYKKINEVGFIAGTCFMLSTKAINRNEDILDERFFMFAEDRDLSLRIRKKGYNLYLLPDISIIHYWGRSCSENSSFCRDVVFCENRYIFLKKNFSIFKALLYRLVIAIGYLKFLLWSNIKVALFIPLGSKDRLYHRKRNEKAKALFFWGMGLSH